MARTPAQRGSFGRWLTRVREERYRRQADALDAMRRLAGLTIAPSEYAQWEAGSRVPRSDNPKVARLYEFFGSTPEDDLPAAPMATDSAAIVAAIDRLTAAVQDHQRSLSGGIEQLAELVGAALGSLADTRAGTPNERGLRD